MTSITDMTTAIAGLVITGLKVYGLGTLKEAVSDTLHVLQPEPVNFCTIQTLPAAFGESAPPYDITTTLRYKLLYAPIGGAGSTLAVPYAKMADMAKAIIEAVAGNAPLTGADMSARAEAFGPVNDPSGKDFWGCDIVFTVYELVG